MSSPKRAHPWLLLPTIDGGGCRPRFVMEMKQTRSKPGGPSRWPIRSTQVRPRFDRLRRAMHEARTTDVADRVDTLIK